MAQRRELKSIFESYSKSEPKKSTITVKEFLGEQFLKNYININLCIYSFILYILLERISL